jgi:penicillin-binding protein 2
MTTIDRHNIKVVAFFICAGFVLAVVRLWQLQVLEGRALRQASEENHLRITSLLAPRGIIYDRNDIPLVKNSPNFCVSLLPDVAQRGDLPAIASLLDMPLEELEKKFDSIEGDVEPVRLKEGLSFEDLSRVEARLSDFPELVVDVDIARDYIYGSLASHLIGYIGKLSPLQAKNPAFADLPREGLTGQWGLEKLYDKDLRGTAGKRMIEVDALGRELRVVGEEQPIKGKDLHLGLDINLQMAAETAFGNRAGAMVAINPKTGELLGFMSKPEFDPNKFVFGLKPEDWKALADDERHPMLNRVIQSQYPPGSTFKIIGAIAALESGLLTPDSKFTCRGGLALGSHVFGCWKKGGHGTINMHQALVESCDVYFYNVGMTIGVDRIARYARAFGLGSRAGLGLGSEKSGLIPDTEWKRVTRNQPWYMGETLNVAIGQGYVSVTPFQMVRMMAAIANGGMLPFITFTKSDLPLKGQPVGLPVKESTYEFVRSALAGVVNDPGGTARLAAHSSIVTIAGKTGTAQTTNSKKGKDDAWFVAYAPVENPEVAIVVMVENGGHGASAAAPIAKKAIEAFMQSKKDAGRQKDI